MPDRLVDKIAGNFRSLQTPPATKRYIQHNLRVFGARQPPRKRQPLVLTEFNGVHSAHIAYSYLANVLAKEHGAAIKAYAPKPSRTFLGRARFHLEKFANRNSFGVYRSFGTADVFSIRITPRQRAKATLLFRGILPALKTKWDLESLEIEGVWVGDLFYDTYLMDYKRATIDRDSSEFLHALLNYIALFVFWQEYFDSNDVRAVNVSHCVYNLAIPLRIAVARGVPAYQANATHMYRLDAQRLFAYNEFFEYRERFSALPAEVQKCGLDEARRRIELRLSGAVGVDMAYSKKSAYGAACEERLLRPSPRKKILIATHCFFDSPHSYGNNIFPDFYEWLDFLGQTSEETDYDWYIKTHPDYLPGTMEIIKSFVARYPKMTLLPAEASHHQIIAEGIDVALTVYGTIAFEYAALGIPVINASQNNPHVAYDFNLHPKSVAEYRRMLHELEALDLRIDRNQVHEYYYMRHIHHTGDLFFNSYDSMVGRLGGYDHQFSPEVYTQWLQEWTSAKHEALLHELTTFVRSGEFRMEEDRARP